MSALDFLQLWLLVNLLGLLVAVRWGESRGAFERPAPDRLSLAVAAHVAESTPGLKLRPCRPMARFVGQWRAEVARWVLRLRVDAWVTRQELWS